MKVLAAARTTLAFSIRTTTTTILTTSPLPRIALHLPSCRINSRSKMSISAAAAYSATARLQQQQQQQPQQPNVLDNVTNSFPTPAEAAAGAATNTSAVETASSSSKDTGRSSAESYTPTALSRWSLLNHKLPLANSIQSIHIYDFDNTCEVSLSILPPDVSEQYMLTPLPSS